MVRVLHIRKLVFFILWAMVSKKTKTVPSNITLWVLKMEIPDHKHFWEKHMPWGEVSSRIMRKLYIGTRKLPRTAM